MFCLIGTCAVGCSLMNILAFPKNPNPKQILNRSGSINQCYSVKVLMDDPSLLLGISRIRNKRKVIFLQQDTVSYQKLRKTAFVTRPDPPADWKTLRLPCCDQTNITHQEQLNLNCRKTAMTDSPITGKLPILSIKSYWTCYKSGKL